MHASKKAITNQLVVIVLSLWIPVATLQQCSKTPTPQQQCNQTLAREERIARVGDTILVKLGMPEAPANPATHVPPTSEMIAEFEAVQATLSILQSGRSCPLQFEIAKSADLVYATSASEVPSRLEDFCLTDYPDHSLCDDFDTKPQAEKEKEKQEDCSLKSGPTLSYKFVFPLNLTNRVLTSLDLVTTKLPSPSLGYPGQSTSSVDGDWVEINLVYPIPCYDYSQCGGAELEGREVITGKLVQSQVEGFEVFNVTRAVQRWVDQLQLDEPVSNLELEIRIRPAVSLHCSGRPFPPSVTFNSTQTYLLMFFKTNNQIAGERDKRQAGSVSPLTPQFCFMDPDIPNCCVRELIINFATDLGWTWILMPPAFSPNYCLGLCPYMWPAATNATNFYQLYHELNPTSAPEPCCGTQSLSSLNMIIEMNGIRTHVTIPDVIVNSCICK